MSSSSADVHLSPVCQQQMTQSYYNYVSGHYIRRPPIYILEDAEHLVISQIVPFQPTSLRDRAFSPCNTEEVPCHQLTSHSLSMLRITQSFFMLGGKPSHSHLHPTVFQLHNASGFNCPCRTNKSFLQQFRHFAPFPLLLSPYQETPVRKQYEKVAHKPKLDPGEIYLDKAPIEALRFTQFQN